MPEHTLAKIMLWGAVRFAMMAYGISVVFALMIVFLSDKHKRNWIGYLSLTFAMLATAIVFFYYTNSKQVSRIELLKALYYYPEETPYQNGGDN